MSSRPFYRTPTFYAPMRMAILSLLWFRWMCHGMLRFPEKPSSVFAQICYSIPHPKTDADGTLIEEQDFNDIHSVQMTDLRTVKGRPDLETDGFTYVTNRKVAGLDISDTLTEDDMKILIDDSIQLAKELTGAQIAIPFFPITRHNTKGGTEDTFHEVHSDYTPLFVKEIIKMYDGFVQVGPSPPSINPNDIEEFDRRVKAGERALLLNVWRPIRTVESVPLGLVSWKSVDPTKNMWPQNYCAERKGYKRQYWTYSSKHEWFYTSNQEPEEIYVMLQHEKSGIDGHGIHVPHVAFHHPETKEGAAGRFSLDIRIALAGVKPKMEPNLDFRTVGPHIGFKISPDLAPEKVHAQYLSWLKNVQGEDWANRWGLPKLRGPTPLRLPQNRPSEEVLDGASKLSTEGNPAAVGVKTADVASKSTLDGFMEGKAHENQVIEQHGGKRFKSQASR